jgi:hypothetical protein
MRVGKTEAIGVSKPRSLEQDELNDFTWNKMTKQEFAKHIAHLYSKYPSRGRIDIYKETYMKRCFYEEKLLTDNSNQSEIVDERINKNAMKVWAKCLEFIGSNVDENAFQTWFLPILPLKLENNKLTLQLPSTFFYHWIEENYVDLLRKTIDIHIGQDTFLEYIV